MSNTVKTRLMNFRVPPDEKIEWERVAKAKGLTVTSWLRRLAREDIELFDAEQSASQDKIEERALITKKMSPQKKSKCPTPAGTYCYAHNTRH